MPLCGAPLRLLAFAIIGTACALGLWPPRAASDDLRITFIDVGQGEAILVQTPRGHTLMIDAGGKSVAEAFSCAHQPERLSLPHPGRLDDYTLHV